MRQPHLAAPDAKLKMADADLLSRLKLNKWTIAVLTLGVGINIGLTRAGSAHRLTWHEVNEIRQWKELVWGLVLAQSGKAVRQWQERSDDGEPPKPPGNIVARLTR